MSEKSKRETRGKEHMTGWVVLTHKAFVKDTELVNIAEGWYDFKRQNKRIRNTFVYPV
jgi:hypothetical protein